MVADAQMVAVAQWQLSGQMVKAVEEINEKRRC